MTFDRCALQQGFGENANDAYGGIKGHPGLDTACGYGSVIYSPVSGKVSALYTPERPASDGFVAVYMLVQTKLELFEFAIGHCSEVMVKLGQNITIGQPIAKEGNKGLVYSNGVKITLAMQKAGDTRGAHRHSQKRPVRLVLKRDKKKQYLQNAEGYLRSERGEYYEYALPYGDYASCRNFARPLFYETLQKGMTHYEVLLLQRALGIPEKFQSGYFGDITLEAVKKLQRTLGLEAVGVVGPATRTYLNERHGQLADPADEDLSVATVELEPGISAEEQELLDQAEVALEATPGPAKDAWSVILRSLRDLLK